MKKTIIILSVFFNLCTGILYAQTEFIDSLDLKLTEAFAKTKIPGFVAVVVDKNGIVYQKTLGYADAKQQKPYTTETLENIGSVSKTFVAVALMKAIDLGYFSLETNINDILPFKVTNPYFPDYQINIKQLTTHTSGIIDNDSIYHKSYKFRVTDKANRDEVSVLAEKGYSGGLPDTTLQTFMYSYLNDSGSLYSKKNFYNSKPGERSSYSNIATALAAYLIELKAGMSFAAFSEKYILHHLNMNSSGWFLSQINIKEHAIPYAAIDFPLPFYELTTYPDGGLITSAADLSKYVIEMINSLNNRAQLLSKKSVNTMFSPAFASEAIPKNFNSAKRTKGVFWNLYKDGFIGHDGDDPGVSTNILFNKDFGIIFMTNIYMEDTSDFVNALKGYAGKIVKE